MALSSDVAAPLNPLFEALYTRLIHPDPTLRETTCRAVTGIARTLRRHGATHVGHVYGCKLLEHCVLSMRMAGSDGEAAA